MPVLGCVVLAWTWLDKIQIVGQSNSAQMSPCGPHAECQSRMRRSSRITTEKIQRSILQIYHLFVLVLTKDKFAAIMRVGKMTTGGPNMVWSRRVSPYALKESLP